MNSTLSSILPSKLPASQKETSTDVSPVRSHTLHARTQRGARPATQSTPALSTYLPQRPVDPSEPRARLVSGAHTCQRGQPTAQVGVAASHATREVLRAQDTPASEHRVTPVAPPTPRTPRRDGRERQDEGDE